MCELVNYKFRKCSHIWGGRLERCEDRKHSKDSPPTCKGHNNTIIEVSGLCQPCTDAALGKALPRGFVAQCRRYGQDPRPGLSASRDDDNQDVQQRTEPAVVGGIQNLYDPNAQAARGQPGPSRGPFYGSQSPKRSHELSQSPERSPELPQSPANDQGNGPGESCYHGRRIDHLPLRSKTPPPLQTTPDYLGGPQTRPESYAMPTLSHRVPPPRNEDTKETYTDWLVRCTYNKDDIEFAWLWYQGEQPGSSEEQ